MTRILLIRHGQSANNALPEEQRVCDPDLTDLGRQQASRLAEYMAKEGRITHLYCSAFRRALETTRPIATRLEVPVRIRADIFEKGGCYSGYDENKRGESGLGARELKAEFPDWEVDHRINDQGWWGKNYETLESAAERARVVHDWFSQDISPQGGVHAMVIHADFKALLLREMVPERKSSYVPLYNTGVTELEWTEGQWRLHALNETQHLDFGLRSN